MVRDCRLNARSLFSDLDFCSQASALIFDCVSSHPDPEALNPNLQPRCFSLELGDRPDGRNEGFGEYSSGFQIQPLLHLPFPLPCFSYVTLGKTLDFSELQFPPVYVKRSVLEPSSSNTCLCREFLISNSLASMPGLPFPHPHLLSLCPHSGKRRTMAPTVMASQCSGLAVCTRGALNMLCTPQGCMHPALSCAFCSHVGSGGCSQGQGSRCT